MASRLDGKACVFLCGSKFGVTQDPVDPEDKIRWMYSNGSGCCDHYCNRAFLKVCSHKYADRAEAAEKLGVDKKLQEQFLEERDRIIARAAKKSTGQLDNADSSGHKTRIRRSESENMKLLPPPDQFLPWAAYKKMYKGKLMKGHKRVRKGRHDGVFMPGETRDDVPWTVQREFSWGNEKAEDIASFSEGEEAEADKQFSEMGQGDDAAYEEIVIGSTFADLMAQASKKGLTT